MITKVVIFARIRLSAKCRRKVAYKRGPASVDGDRRPLKSVDTLTSGLPPGNDRRWLHAHEHHHSGRRTGCYSVRPAASAMQRIQDERSCRPDRCGWRQRAYESLPSVKCWRIQEISAASSGSGTTPCWANCASASSNLARALERSPSRKATVDSSRVR